MLSNVPGTSTTGYGCSAEGLQDQSLAPGGETSTAWAGAAISEEARTAAAATDRARLSNDMETSLFVCLGRGPELMVLGGVPISSGRGVARWQRSGPCEQEVR